MKTKLINHLELIVKLMELHNENPFKIKAYKNSADIIYKINLSDENIFTIEWNTLKGIGDSLSKTIQEFLLTGNSQICQKYLQETPSSILELIFSIRGLGVKRVAILWKQHHILSIDDLMLQCKENKIAQLTGFGEKFQEKILHRIEFFMQHKGLKLYAKTITLAENFILQLQKKFPDFQFVLSGELRQQLPIVKNIVLVSNISELLLEKYLKENNFDIQQSHTDFIRCSNAYYGEVVIYFAHQQNFGTVLLKTSASGDFLSHIKQLFDAPSEEEIFSFNHIPFMPPFLRESGKAIYTPPERLKNIIQTSNIKGLIHCHTKWSDGENTINEMAQAAIQQGLEYMVLTDHSKSSFVANGLSVERLKEQYPEIDKLNKKLYPFKIFKSIECDILNNGNLDYDDEILASFDLVIVSVHNNLDMTKNQATERVLNALQNPYTHILGHSSGRLLLNRQGYELDYERIFESCVKNNVILELNANPFRLDIDWQYLPQMQAHHIKTSINPDAHSLEGIKDIQFGVAVAQKAALMPSENLSSLTLSEFEKYIQEWKLKKLYK